MVYCHQCGKKNDEGTKFCSDCGNKLSLSTNPQTNLRRDNEQADREHVDKKGHKGLAFLIIILIIIAGVIAFRLFAPTGAVIKGIYEPQLSVSGISLDTHWSISKGCYSEVEGYVSNTGNANADGATISCNLIGGGTGRMSKNVGAVPNGGNSYFSMEIDNECPAPSDVQCSVSCQNCN